MEDKEQSHIRNELFVQGKENKHKERGGRNILLSQVELQERTETSAFTRNITGEELCMRGYNTSQEHI